MYYVGIDLGGTAIKGGIVDKTGDILIKNEIKTESEGGFEKVADNIKRLIKQLIKDLGIDIKDVKSIGIGMPGVANKEGLVYYANNLKWENAPLGDVIRAEFEGIPVHIENDATVAGVAEYVKGSMKGCSSGIMITLGTGLGGGIIIDGKAFSGFNGLGSELGHMLLGENFFDCNCGNNGCFETFASATAVIRHARKLIEEDKMESIITSKVSLDDLNAKVIFDSAKEGDTVANMVVDRLVKYLAMGIGTLMNVFDPEIIAIGGGLSKAGDYLLDKVNKEIYNYVVFKKLKYGKVVIASLGNDAGIIGSAMLG